MKYLRTNIISVSLLATFIVIFGSILSMALFTKSEGPTMMDVEAAVEQQ